MVVTPRGNRAAALMHRHLSCPFPGDLWDPCLPQFLGEAEGEQPMGLASARWELQGKAAGQLGKMVVPLASCLAVLDGCYHCGFLFIGRLEAVNCITI